MDVTPDNQEPDLVSASPSATSVRAPLEGVDTNFLNNAVQSALMLEPQILSSEQETTTLISKPNLDSSSSQTNPVVTIGEVKMEEKASMPPSATPERMTVEDGGNLEHVSQATTLSASPLLATPKSTNAYVSKAVPIHGPVLNSMSTSHADPLPTSTAALQAINPKTSTMPEPLPTTITAALQAITPKTSAVPEATSKQLLSDQSVVNASTSNPSVASTLRNLQAGETATLSSLLESLQRSDITLADLLSLNIPQLAHLQEGLRALFQNALLLQTLKSGAANIQAPSVPVQDKPLLTSSGVSASQSRRAPVMARIITREKPQAQPIAATSTSVPSSVHCLVTPSRQPVQPVLPKSTTAAVTPLQVPKSQSHVTTVGNVRMSLLSKMQQSAHTASSAVAAAAAAAAAAASTSTLQSVSSSSVTSPSGLKTRPATRAMSRLSATSIPLVNPRASSPPNTLSTATPTLVQPMDQEPMDIDVGVSLTRMELPAHLTDHNYCIYNPTVMVTRQSTSDSVLNIPSERLSYAPEVPDSPRTLYKLLKVIPRKGSTSGTSRVRNQSRASTPSSSTSRSRPARKVTLSSRRKRTGGSRKVHGESGDESFGTPEVSDSEDLSTRRRSQRNMGQRKRYIDDVDLSLSDEEVIEDIMQPPPKRTAFYGQVQEEEESDYEDASTPNNRQKASKYKKAITVNPTEGFRYSDIYLDAPPEEANVVERILSHRSRLSADFHEQLKYGQFVEEYLVKYKNYSYLHVKWATVDKLLEGDKRFEGKVKRYKAKQELMGMFINIDDEPFNPDYTEADRILDVATQKESNGEITTHYLVKWKSLPYEDSTWELEEDVDQDKIRMFKEHQLLPPKQQLMFVRRPPPASFKPIKESPIYKDGNKLRPYQLEGLNWLLFNWYTRQNCILADEMGLGKTVQSIAFILAVMEAHIRGPYLVIAPLSTITNWQREFETWTDLNVVVYHGSAYSRRMIHEYELYYRNSNGKIVSDQYKFNVIVTTYEVMLSDNSELQNVLWRLVIIDEAHRLKNKNCKMLEGLKELQMEHRVLLTGTPLQNSVEELFSLLNFLEPTKFASLPLFMQQFGQLKSEEHVKELKSILKPMMLRRLKEDVEKTLAPKEETIVEVELTAIQKQYYRAILEKNFNFLTTKSTAPSLLNTMMELRKCCNHPFLITGAEQKIVSDFKARHPGQPTTGALIQASGKLVLIDKLLPKLKEKGHKVLIFSQMVRCLDILEDYLRIKKYFYERIDGQVRGTLRQAAIDRFSKPELDRFVFLLCTRAGGLGINLTAADTVIIYDSDWNPQNDIQAQARCHRIGQNKMVKVYRLITRNSYEREMFDRASLKLGLDRAVLQSMNSQQQQNNGPPQLSKKEIEDLLKKGAYGAIMESDDAANQFCEEDIDQILERRTQVIQLESAGKGSTFSKASFVSDESTDISIDDPDFWQKWAAKANLDLDQLANKDNLVLDTPRVRRQVRRYGNELLETIVDMDESQEEIVDVLPSRGRKGWTKLECLKTEKGLCVYGWGQWKDVLKYGRFKKRQLSLKDVENISRTMLVYCLNHFTGDEKVKVYIHKLIDPSEETESNVETNGDEQDMFSEFTEDDYLALMAKEPETLFQDESYMKHLRRHATRILLRVRQLHIIRWGLMRPYIGRIMSGVLAADLGLKPPVPEESPPAPWWDSQCDLSLLVAVIKHGFEQFCHWRSDRTLVFYSLVGEQPLTAKKSKKGKANCTPGKIKGDPDDDDYDDDDDEDEEMELAVDDEDDSGPESSQGSVLGNTPKTVTRRTRGSDTNLHILCWPSLADVNTRARRLVSAYLKQQKRDELRQVQLVKELERKERVAELSRKRELKKAELAQKWSKREEADFARVIAFFGVEFEEKSNRYNWTRFRQLASLGKKSDERLTLYLHDFKEMCRRVIKRKRAKTGLSGMKIEPVYEERAIKCLQRLDILTAVRKEILPHPEFNKLIRLCEASFEVPHWWIPGMYDRDLLRGVVKHGLFRTDNLVYNDPELSFLASVPQSALFTPNSISEVGDEMSDSDEDQEGKLRTSGGAAVTVPLGWPKEKAIIIRISRIIYAFRNRVWPKPMEGLDLFNPLNTIQNDSSSSSSSEEEDEEDEEVATRNNFSSPSSDHESDDDYMLEEKRRKMIRPKSTVGQSQSTNLVLSLSPNVPAALSNGNQHETNGTGNVGDFQVQKQHGLKMTLKKGPGLPKPQSDGADHPPLTVRIPLPILMQHNKKVTKRIPKKKPTSEGQIDSSEGKKTKPHRVLIVDPSKLTVSDLTGLERVGVVNRNNREKLPMNHSPALKKLESWLKVHPHFNVEAKWGPLVIAWGALKPAMYNRILQGSEIKGTPTPMASTALSHTVSANAPSTDPDIHREPLSD